jgi:hypothetical protein
MRRSITLLPLLAALAGGCSLYNHLEPLDMTGCLPSPACVNGGGDMHVVLDGGGDGMCMIMCPGPDMDMTVVDMAHECLDSSTCPVDRPVCNSSGACVKCAAANDAGMSNECSMYHSGTTPPTPLCGAAGACVQCLSKDDCAQFNETCNMTTNQCAPCQKHSDCSTGVCKTGGTCASPSEVAYVNNGITCNDARVTPSTPTDPYCQIQAAVTASPSPKPYVVVAGSSTTYNAVSLTAVATAIGPVAIIGPGRAASPTAKIAPASSPAIAVTTAGATATLTVDGLELIGSGGGSPSAAVKCSVTTGTASITVVNSSLHNSGGAGVDANGCTITVDANIVGPSNAGGGLTFSGTTSYTVTNNIIWGNGGVAATVPGVQLGNSTTGAFAFNTVVKNTVSGAAGVGGIDCGSGGTKAIQDSIFYQNTTSGGTQLGSKCTLTNIVTVSGDDNQGSMSAMAPAFVGATDYHLVAGAVANLACCIDKLAAPGTPNANHDVDNTTRPKGTSATPYDISADEH